MVKVGSWLYSFDPVKMFRVQLLMCCHSCDHRATKVLAENVTHLDLVILVMNYVLSVGALNDSCCCLTHIKRKDFPDFAGPK